MTSTRNCTKQKIVKGRRCVIAIYRAPKDRDYTVMSNHHLRDQQLSLKAKGLLSQMLSLPLDWDYSVGGLAQINKESKCAIRSALAELERQGYLKRSQHTDAAGRLVKNEYTIYEVPSLANTPYSHPPCDCQTADNRTESNIDRIKMIWGCDDWI